MDIVQEFIKKVSEMTGLPKEIFFAFLGSHFQYGTVRMNIEGGDKYSDAVENAKPIIEMIAAEFGFGTESREYGRVELAVNAAEMRPNGKFKLFPENSNKLNKAWRRLKKEEEALFADCGTQQTENSRSESEPQAAREPVALAEKTFGKVASEVWNDQKDRNDIIGAAILAGLLMLGACIATEYINVKDAEDQKVGAKLKEATKKTAKNHRTWLKVGIFAILAGGVTFACKYKARS
ncbi:hypothetical protein HDR66_00330 [bacterium]|nr:hypothetical protein [bacterium]